MNILLSVILFFLLLFFVFSISFGDKKYKEAKSLEEQKKYKDACYLYAIAILNGSFARRECRKRIKYLWEQYGPFDYRNVLEQIKKEGDTHEGCSSAGHACTILIIEEVVTGAKKKISK